MEDNKPWDNPNWRHHMLDFTTSGAEIRLLKEGPSNHMEAMRLSYLHNKYRRIMGYKEPEKKNLQSSFKEWNKSVKE